MMVVVVAAAAVVGAHEAGHDGCAQAILRRIQACEPYYDHVAWEVCSYNANMRMLV